MHIKKIKRISKKLAMEFGLDDTYRAFKEKTNDFLLKSKEIAKKTKDIIEKESIQYDVDFLVERLMSMQGERFEFVVEVVEGTYSIRIIEKIFEGVDNDYLSCQLKALSNKPEMLFLSMLLSKKNHDFLDEFKEEFGENIFDYITFFTTIDFVSEEKIKDFIYCFYNKKEMIENIDLQDSFLNEPFEYVAEIMKTTLTKDNLKVSLKDMTLTYSTNIEIKDEYEKRIEEIILSKVKNNTTDLFFSNILNLVLSGQVSSMDIVIIRKKEEIDFYVTSLN